MSYTYQINKEKSLNYVKGSGVVLGSEILATTEKMFNDPDWIYVKKQINNFLQIKELVISINEFEKLIELEKQSVVQQNKILTGETGQLAIVAQKELYDIIFQLYAFKTKGLSHDTKMFNTVDEALLWLKVSESSSPKNESKEVKSEKKLSNKF